MYNVHDYCNFKPLNQQLCLTVEKMGALEFITIIESKLTSSITVCFSSILQPNAKNCSAKSRNHPRLSAPLLTLSQMHNPRSK